MILALIAGMDKNHLIGKNNQLPWRLPADLKHFKKLTIGHPIIMGRKTFESLGKPLPQRTNIVLTRDQNFSAEGCIVVHSPDEAIQQAKQHDTEIAFIIGGSNIFELMLPFVERMYLTFIHDSFEGDAFFPNLDWKMWKEVSRENHAPDEKNPYPYSFVTYVKE